MELRSVIKSALPSRIQIILNSEKYEPASKQHVPSWVAYGSLLFSNTFQRTWNNRQACAPEEKVCPGLRSTVLIHGFNSQILNFSHRKDVWCWSQNIDIYTPPQKKRRRRGKKEKKVWGWGWGDKALPKQNKNLLKCCFEVKPLQWHLAKNLLRWQGSCSSGMWRNANCTVLNPHSYWEFVLTIYSFINILCSARNKIVENVSIWGTTAYFSSCSWIFASTGHSSLLL